MKLASDKFCRARPFLGTFVEIITSPEPHCNSAVELAFEAIFKTQKLMSYYEYDSDISRLNRADSKVPVAVDAWTFEVLKTANELYERSEGLFNIAAESMSAKQEARIEKQPFKLLSDLQVRKTKTEMQINLGGIAKGYAVDRALEVLRQSGLKSGLVNAGGDIAGFGPESFDIQIRNPSNPSTLLCELNLQNEALASSAGNFDPFENTRTGPSAIVGPAHKNFALSCLGATVRASTCMMADALTKIVMISGTESLELLEYYGAHALFVSKQSEIFTSPGWKKIG